MSKKNNKLWSLVALVLLVVIVAVPCGFALSSCSLFSTVSVESITKTGSSGLVDVYTIKFTDGSSTTFTVTNGSDGADATSPTITEIWEAYNEQYPDATLTYAEFLSLYFSGTAQYSSTSVVADILNSTLKVYTKFVENPSSSNKLTKTDYVFYTGAAVIYKMDTAQNGYTYLITNYHVCYDNDANVIYNATKLPLSIYGYLYGSEDEPCRTSKLTSDGFTTYDYGDYGIELEYVGGSITQDIAILKVETSKILAINSSAKAVTVATGYSVGETAIAVGNPEGCGISVTKGIVCVDSETIELSDIDGTERNYRVMRIDTAIYGGNSGGGLFNCNGELIGIVNAGHTEDQNINFALPIDQVVAAADNLLYYYLTTSQASTLSGVTIGITTTETNSKYVYNPETCSGQIEADATIVSVTGGSIAQSLGLAKNYVINAIIINEIEHTIIRDYQIDTYLLTCRVGDSISFAYTDASGNSGTTQTYTLKSDDINAL